MSNIAINRAKELFEKHFKTSLPLAIRKLSGGYSEASNFCLTLDKSYVLRVYPSDYPLTRIEKEFYMLEESSKLGIAPHVYGIYLEDRAVIMDFIYGQTQTIEQAHLKDNRIKVAIALRKLHATKKNPYVESNFRERMEKLFTKLCPLMENKKVLIEVSEVVRDFYG